MARKREHRLRRRLAAANRDARTDAAVIAAAVRYAFEIYYPNIKEPFSIVNRRNELVEAVETMRSRRGLSPIRPMRRAA